MHRFPNKPLEQMLFILKNSLQRGQCQRFTEASWPGQKINPLRFSY